MTVTRTLRLRNLPADGGHCRACGAPVLWARTERGAPMILDRWAPLREDSGGALVVIDAASTHWSSCRERAQFQKRR